jgi:hypothetical protein
LIPAGTGEQIGDQNHINFNIPIIEKPTMTEKAKVALENAADLTKVEIHNAKESVVTKVLNVGEVLKEGIIHLVDRVEHAVEHALDLDQPVATEFNIINAPLLSEGSLEDLEQHIITN